LIVDSEIYSDAKTALFHLCLGKGTHTSLFDHFTDPINSFCIGKHTKIVKLQLVQNISLVGSIFAESFMHNVVSTQKLISRHWSLSWHDNETTQNISSHSGIRKLIGYILPALWWGQGLED